MQASKIFYPGKIFFMQAIKKKIVYTSTFCRLYKPLACINPLDINYKELIKTKKFKFTSWLFIPLSLNRH